MDSLRSLDLALFHFINIDLKNGFFDSFLPFFSSNSLFVPALIILAAWFTWRGGVRGRLLVFFLLLTFVIGDPIIVNSLKHWFARPRPFDALKGVHLVVGRSESGSMPSGHAANWFAAAVVSGIYYRSSCWFMFPLALLEAFSRVYLGVHYPSDVLAGGVLGATYSFLIVTACNLIWGVLGRRLFPIWWAAAPSLLLPASSGPPDDLAGSTRLPRAFKAEWRPDSLDQHWIRLAYLLIGSVLVGHFVYLASGKIELSEDEAYQWLWSKHLALSYYSKPPMIAYTQFLGTSLFGDSEFGVRFFSPVIAALTSLILVRFMARESNGVVACATVLVATAVPLLMVGATLMTIDSLSVLFWVAATLAGWRALQRDSTNDWCWAGLWIALGSLSKYTGLFQWLCWAVLFVLWAPARRQLRRPGLYLALLITVLGLLPVLFWNAKNGWITLTHLANRGGLDKGWEPTFRFLWDFLLSEAFLLNPVFFVGLIWSALFFWRRPGEKAFQIYVFCMSAPLFLFYLGYTLRARVQPNWVAPAILPLFCLMLVYWDEQRRKGMTLVSHVFMVGIALGWLVVVPLHDTKLVAKITGHPLSWKLEPLTRVLGWKETARVVNRARLDLAAEGKTTFIIGSHYGITSLMTFYIPEAKVAAASLPLVYFESSEEPKNQFYFWPGYRSRKGQNAIYIAPVDRPESPLPENLQREFASVTDLGVREIIYNNRLFHHVRLYACRDLL